MIVNEVGLERSKAVRKEIYRTIFIGPVYAIFMLTLIYLGTSKNITAFYMIGLFFLVFFLILIVYAPSKMIKRHTHTICKITIEDSLFSFSTFSELWIPKKTFKISISELKIKKSIFLWYGKNTARNGLTFLIKQEEFYLVKDFFDEYEFFVSTISE